jgi:hypothetical protein
MASRKKLKVQNATANSLSSKPTENELNPTVQSKKWPTVPAPLMEMIFNFCYEHGFSKAGHHIRLETQRREKTSDYDQPCSWTNASLGFPSVVEMFNEWQSSHRDSLLMQEKSTARQLVGIKDKVDAISPSADSESDNESSWSSSSSSDSEDSDSDIEAAKIGGSIVKAPITPAVELMAPNIGVGSVSSSSSSDSDPNISSDSSSSESDDDAPSIPDTSFKPQLKRKAVSPSVSQSNSDSESSNSSESESDTEPPAKRIRVESGTERQVVKDPSPSDSDSDSDSDSSSSSDTSSSSGSSDAGDAASTPAENTQPTSVAGASSESSVTLTRTSPDSRFNASTSDPQNVDKALKKNHERFRRVPENQHVDPKFASNAYQSYDYAENAYRDLNVTKGKGFTKEKNKKKRGSYKGGSIDVYGVKAIKFDE